MIYKFGFELEGFWSIGDGLPPRGYPTDGFPGLIEFRSNGGKSLEKAFASMLSHMYGYDTSGFSLLPYKTYTPEQKRLIRKVGATKTPCDIRNIYDKKPKSLGNKTIASLQINISNQTSSSYTDDKGKFHPNQYGLLDAPRIVKALDKTFAEEIKMAGRQQGEYCIKGERLEYRSLPNSIFPHTHVTVKQFLDKIRKAVEA